MEKNSGVIAETLFVACTRPTTIVGVPYSAVMIEAIIVTEVFIMSRNLLMLLAIIPVHGIFYLLCRKEPRIFELIQLWGITKFDTLISTFGHWKASTYSPLAIHVSRDERTLSRKLKP